MAAERVGAAKRRRDRQLRAFRRHELLTVRMELAAALHHSAQRVEVPREVEEYATHVGPRAQKTPPPGMRPASLAEPQGAQERVQRRTMEHVVDFVPVVPLLDVPVPQMVDQLVDILKIIAKLSPAVDEQVIHGWYTACPMDPPGGDHRQPRAVYKYWARMKFFHSLVPGSHCSVLVLPEVYRFMDFSGRRLLVFRVQFSLVRQWIHVWRQSMRLLEDFLALLVFDTKHTIYELCLPSERGFGMCMDLADPVSSGKYSGTLVFTAPVAEPTLMSFTVPLNGCTIVPTATVVTSCSSSADCPDSAAQCAAGVFASRCRLVVEFSLLMVLTILFGTV